MKWQRLIPFEKLADTLVKHLTGILNYCDTKVRFGVVEALGVLLLGGLSIQKLWGHSMMDEHGPLLVAGALLIVIGVMMFSTGLLGEVLMRTYFESQGRRIYAVREIRCRREPVAPA